MHWLDTHSAGVQAAATVVLVIITGVYAWLTRSINKSANESANAARQSAAAARASVAEMQQQRRDNVRPIIVVRDPKFRFDGGAETKTYRFTMNAFNIGRSAAFDVTLDVDLEHFIDRSSIRFLTPHETNHEQVAVSTGGSITIKDFGGPREFIVSYVDVLGNRYETVVKGRVVGRDNQGQRDVELDQPTFRFVERS